MKKMTFKKFFGGICCAAMMVFAVSCAQGVDDEVYKSTATNQQMVSPTLTEANFSTVVNADGSESVKVSWDLIKGCGGCQCYVWIVDDPANPVEIVNKVVDGTSFLFEKLEDTDYKVSVLALGNKANNNTDATAASEATYTTKVPAILVPAGTELSSFIAENLDLEKVGEQAFELEAGQNYPVTGIIDFKDKLVTFRGNKVNRPIVTFEAGQTSGLMTAGGLKVKFINFDCTNMAFDKYVYGSSKETSTYNYAFLNMGDGTYPQLLSATNKGYVLADPIIFEQCNFKNLPKAFIGCGYNAWLVQDFRITDCIINIKHCNLDHDNANFISFYKNCGGYNGEFGKAWTGAVQNVTIKNSTIYNTETISGTKKVRFMRWAGKNGIKDIMGSHTGTFTIQNCTLRNVYHQGEFGNNIAEDAAYVVTYGSTIFYDCARVQKLANVGNNKSKLNLPSKNVGWVATPNNAEGGEMLSGNDKSKVKLTEEDPGFGEMTELDLTDSQFGGQNFKPTGTVSATIGDPRWL